MITHLFFCLHEYRNNQLRVATQKAAGINPYPHKFQQTISFPEYRRKYENLENGEHREGEQESLAGRVRNIRYSRNVTFCDLHGPGGKVQVMVDRRRPELDESDFSKFNNSVKAGDTLGIVGFPGKSGKGELSIFPKTFIVLVPCLHTPQKAKSAAAADNAWTPGRGRNPDARILKDPETRFRQRYMDMMLNPEAIRIFDTRAKIISFIRRFLDTREFMEIGPCSLLEAPIDDDQSRFIVTKSHCENPTCPRDLIYPPDDCHYNDTRLFSLQICRVEDIVVNGMIKGSIIQIHRAMSIIVDTHGIITASDTQHYHDPQPTTTLKLQQPQHYHDPQP